MRYTHFKISNFKGIEDLELDLSKLPVTPVFAFVGLNESGKTTILEALDWLLTPNNYEAHQIIPKSELLSFTGKIAVEATLTLTSQDEEALAKYISKEHRGFKVHSKLGIVLIRRAFEYENSTCIDKNIDYEFSFEGKSRQMPAERKILKSDTRWDTAKGFIEKSLLPPIIYYQNFLFDFPDRIYLESISLEDSVQNESPIEPASGQEGVPPNEPPPARSPSSPTRKLSVEDLVYQDIIQDVLRSIGASYTIEKLLLERYKRGKKNDLSSIEAVLNRMGSKVTQEVFTIWNDLLKIDEASGMEVTFGDTVKVDEKGIYIDVKIKEQDESYFIRERSLGFRWFFAFFLFTHFRAYRYEDTANALFLLDEPASNLHPSAQAKLLGVFENFPYKQTIVYATHSHHMINPKWLAGTFVIRNTGKGYGDIGLHFSTRLTDIAAVPYYQFASDNPKDTYYYRPILDALDYQPSQLEFTPETILLEGRNDFYTLKFMKDSGQVTTSIDAILYPGAGKDKMDYVVSLYVGWAKNIVILLDDDTGGRKTLKRLNKEFGVVLKNRVFTLGDVDSTFDGISMEEVFVDPDPMKIVKETFPNSSTYKKSEFNTALQDCWINQKNLTLHKYTVLRFKKIFRFLEQKIAENR